ncbi:hypothetical protein [Paenibacillus xylanexedens]|uniref:hypothetical protein n=1 Tax=Paenibacillus xylanexedens TaxID=528191 RepID=UPI0011A12A49|nr:hypothetical protein [Paenibacillus xylanexedens]
MAGKFTRLQKAYRMADADGVAYYTAVVAAGAEYCKKPTTDNEVPLGVVDNDERIADGYSLTGDQTGKQISVKLEGIAAIRLEGTIAAGDRVIIGAGGVAKKIPATAGQYNVLGFSEVDGVAGDIIYVRMAYHVWTVA